MCFFVCMGSDKRTWATVVVFGFRGQGGGASGGGSASDGRGGTGAGGGGGGGGWRGFVVVVVGLVGVGGTLLLVAAGLGAGGVDCNGDRVR